MLFDRIGSDNKEYTKGTPMRHLTLMIAAACLLLLQGMALAEGKDARREKYIQSLLTDKPASYYKMDINQITPAEGITTGHLIAYGHYIKPPYKVEVRDTCVFVNNVQVHPILWTPGMKKEKEEGIRRGKEELKTNKNLIAVNNARALFDTLLENNNSSLEAMKKVVDYLHNHKDFKDSIISYDSRLIYVRYKQFFGKKEVDGWQKCIGFNMPKYESSTPMLTPEQMARQFEQSLLGALKKGWLILKSPPGSSASLNRDDFYKFRATLLDNSISNKEKIKQIEKVTGDVHALMMLYNFKRSEWVNNGE
jgi:hypothetical protein